MIVNQKMSLLGGGFLNKWLWNLVSILCDINIMGAENPIGLHAEPFYAIIFSQPGNQWLLDSIRTHGIFFLPFHLSSRGLRNHPLT